MADQAEDRLVVVQLLEASNSGELDPLLLGRRSLPAYATGLRRGLNCLALPHGPTVRRPGNRRAGAAHSTARWTQSFIFGVGDAYALEFLDLKIRFWRADGTQVESAPGVPYEIGTDYTATQAKAVRWQRSGDVMWAVHPSYPMRELKRTALPPNETFTFLPAIELDGPYFPENATLTTVTTGSTGAGSMDVTFSAAVLDTSSPSKDIGRQIRIKLGIAENQGWADGTIIAVASTTVCTLALRTPVGTIGSTAAWRLGLYSERTGYASSIALFQERLARGSNVTGSFPRVDFSRSGNFLNSGPGTDDDHAVQAVIAITVDDNGVPAIRDLKAGAGALLVATGAGALRIGSSSTGSSTLTPLNVSVDPIEGSFGAGTVPAISIGASMLYLDVQHRGLGELRQAVAGVAESYAFREISIRNGHLLRESPIVSMAWASRPWGLIVLARADGKFVLGSYAPKEEVINFMPSALAASGHVESVNALPTTDGSEIWMMVERAGVRGLEVMTLLLREDQPDRLAVNLDSAISSKVAPAATLTYVSTDGDGVQTWQAGSAVFDTVADVGRAIRVLEAGDRDRLNMPTWSARTLRIVTVPSTSTITATVESAAAPTSPVASGDWLLSRTVVSGLGALEGQSILLLADGAEQGPLTVASGAVTLPDEAFYVTAGLAYRSEMQPMPPNPQTAKGSALGRPVGGRLRASVVRSMGLKQVKFDGTLSGPRPLRQGQMPAGVAPPFYTGDLELEPLPDTGNSPVAPFLVADGAYPFCIAALAPDYGVGELG